ncbi:MAG: metallophosphoesterase family protein [Clostridia bacterium]|nr:metallophosphoesterase family protein [Clostridia bacterium]
MKILAIADDEDKRYYDHYKPGCLDEFGLILACGDLSRPYLEFLVTMARCPLVYVHGNHDDSFVENPPGGCICADDKLVTVNGIRILGLGGSYRYKKSGHFMYTEWEMKRRAWKLAPKLLFNHGFDILLTHAPALGVNDFDTLTHRGFDTFNKLVNKHHPSYLIHGHIHKNYGFKIPTVSEHNGTTVVNAYESVIIDAPFGE